MPQKFSSEFNRTNFESAWEKHNILQPTKTCELQCGAISFLFSFQLKERKKAIAHIAANRKRKPKLGYVVMTATFPYVSGTVIKTSIPWSDNGLLF